MVMVLAMFTAHVSLAKVLHPRILSCGDYRNVKSQWVLMA